MNRTVLSLKSCASAPWALLVANNDEKKTAASNIRNVGIYPPQPPWSLPLAHERLVGNFGLPRAHVAIMDEAILFQ
jgi:hypothetical protein